MAGSQDPALGLWFGWGVGENGWKPGMDANMQKLGALVMPSVLGIANSPTDTTNGARYIVGTTPTGDFVGQANKLAVRIGGVWVFYTPSSGWSMLNRATSKTVIFSGTSWANEVIIASAPPVLDANNPGVWSFSGSTWTKVPLYTVTTDTSLAWDATGNTDYVVPRAGLYLVRGTIRPVRTGANNLPNTTSIAVGVGTSAVDSADVVWNGGSPTTNVFSVTANRLIRCALGDRVFLFARHEASTAVALTYAKLSIVQISE